MKNYLFVVNLSAKSEKEPRLVFIDLQAEDWDELVAGEKITGDFFDTCELNHFLKYEAFCMYGHTFNPERHTPRQLYEALNSNSAFELTIQGDKPSTLYDEDEDLLPDECS